MLQEKSKFELLLDERIIHILDGDTNFGRLVINGANSNITISMPYLTSQALYDIAAKFGMNNICYGQNRYEYLYNLLSLCIQRECEMDLIVLLFSKKQFVSKLIKQPRGIVEYAYSEIVKTVIKQINHILYFYDNELVQNGDVFVIRELSSIVKAYTPSLKIIDRKYIKDMSDRAIKDILDGYYDSAITKSRTLLEEVFCYVIEKKGNKPSESGDIGKLYNQVKQLYNMHQSKDIDKRINGLLSGLEKILSAIAEMRNKGSDAHGVGEKRIKIADHHARLFVNSAIIIMADFILSVSEKAS